jgi:nuclear pore complex protein Nup205
MSFELGSDRKRLGKLPVQDEEYAINEDFQQTSLQLADALDLDEIEAARIALESLADAEILGRSLLESSIIRFHQTRKYLLGSFRLMLHVASDLNIPELIRDTMREVIDQVLRSSGGSKEKSSFVAQCLEKMGEIRTMVQNLTDRLNGTSLLGQIHKSELHETIEYQRASFVQQHESLGIIVQFLVKSHNAVPKDFEQIIEILKRADKYDSLLGRSCFHVLTY